MTKKFFVILLLITILGFVPFLFSANVKGIVYDENKNPVKNLSLRFAAIGTVVTTNSGEFIIEIPPGTNETEVSSEDKNWTVLYPVDSRIAVPADPGFIIKIVVSRTSGSIPNVNDIAKKFIKLENTLKEIGFAQDDLKSLMENFVAKQSADKNIEEDNLKSAIYKEKRNGKFSEISYALSQYLLKVQNLRDGFKIVAEYAFQDSNAMKELIKFVNEYTEAFNPVYNNKFAYKADVQLLWEDKTLAADLYDVVNYALEEIHKPYILSLNDDIVEINKLWQLYRRGDKNEDVKNKVTADINYSVKEMDIKLPVLERRINEILIKLQQDI